MGGYIGKIMFINLKTQTWRTEEPGDQFYRDYIGGYGLGARILFEHVKPGCDPLGPENVLGFIAGLLVGTKAHATGRFNVVAKSPLTGGWGDAGCGGHFGPKLKATGYDAIFFEDVSPTPVYVSIFNDKVKFHDASHIWGLDATETEIKVKEEVGKRYAVASIGQAGEKLSAIAGIFNDSGRAAARMGIGGVMGSKNLKAVAAGGTRKAEIADEEKFRKAFEKMKEMIATASKGPFAKYGTTMVFPNNLNIGDSAVKNWKVTKTGHYTVEQAMKVSGDAYMPFHRRKYGCAQCALACGAILDVVDKDGNEYETHRPEYETISCFASLLLMDDLDAVLEGNEVCNRYGMDTIAVGGTIAWLLECVEEGLLTEEEQEGMDLTWGNHEILVPLIRKMALREGFLGELMADGSKAAAEKLGRGSEAYLTDCGGVELAMHDPRCWPGFGYGYALDPTPGHHCQGVVGFMEHGWRDAELYEEYNYDHLAEEKYMFDKDDKGWAHKHISSWFHFFNGTGMCILAKYAGYRDYPVIDTISAVTGWENLSIDEALKTGERINTLRHLFNVREGIHHTQFALKDRMVGIPPLEDGPTAGITIPMDKITADYYEAMGWDLETDMPFDETLDNLGIKEFVHENME